MQTAVPIGDRVIVRRMESETVSPGGILIPEVAKEKPITGIVLAVGKGRWIEATGQYEPMILKKNDVVLFGKFSGVETRLFDETVLILRQDDILCVIQES